MFVYKKIVFCFISFKTAVRNSPWEGEVDNMHATLMHDAPLSM